MKQFYKDLEQAHKAEQLVLQTLQNLTNDYQFIDVSEQKEYYHKGDIKAVDNDGNEIMIEVKDDSKIAETHKVLCEESVYYNSCEEFVDGNFHSDYQIYCVVSRAENKIYIMDFNILKQHYKSGEFKVIPHADQTTYCYLLPLGVIRRCGAMVAEICF